MTDEEKKEVELEQEFEDIIRHKMTSEQFKEWFMNWFETDLVIEMALGWDMETKIDELHNLREIIKNNNK